MARGRLASIASTLLAALVFGCGGGETSTTTTTVFDRPADPDRLPRELVDRAYAHQGTIAAYCRELTTALRSRTPPPPRRERRRALAAARNLAELALERPFDLIQTGVDVRLFTGDVIEDLESLDCDPKVIQELAAGLG